MHAAIMKEMNYIAAAVDKPDACFGLISPHQHSIASNLTLSTHIDHMCTCRVHMRKCSKCDVGTTIGKAD